MILASLICVTAILSKYAIEASTYGELTAISKSNAGQIQAIFDAAGTAARDMQNYLEKAHRIANENPSQLQMPTEPEAISMCQSVIYTKLLSPLNYDVEQFMSETAHNAAVNNEDIEGVGVMFEPMRSNRKSGITRFMWMRAT